MKFYYRIIVVAIVSLVIFCCEGSPPPRKIEWATMEIFLINGRYDTVNRIDGAGKKQGKWIPSPLNDLRDTVYYIDDSLIKHLHQE